MSEHRTFLSELLSVNATASLEVRADNAFAAARKLFDLLEQKIKDKDDLDKIQKAWLRAVKDNDFSKFKRILKKYGQ